MNEQTKTITKMLGISGRMIAGSKTMYRQAYPNNIPVFNGNIITTQGKVWWGDLDLTTDNEILQEIANTLNDTVCVLREMDARFENEGKSFDEYLPLSLKTYTPQI